MNSRILFFVFFTYLWAINLSASNNSEKKTTTIKVSTSKIGKMPWELDAPAYAFFTFSQSVYGLPLRLDEDYNLVPSLIVDWQWDYEKDWYVITIDKEIKFHNGRNVNSKDLEFFLVRSFLSTKDLQQNKWLENIKGIDSLVKGDKFVSGKVSGIKVLNDSQISIALKVKNPYFLYLFTRSVPSIKPIEELQEDYFSFKKFPVGVGPYRVTGHDEKKGLVHLERFLQYNEKVRVNEPGKIELYVREVSDPDITIGASKAPDESGNYRFESSENPSAVSILNFNFNNKTANISEFRRAIYSGVNRSKLVETYKGFRPAFEMLPENMWGRAKASDPFDRKSAKEMLRKVSDKVLAKTHKFFYHGSPNQTPDYIVALEKELNSLGIKATFEVTQQHLLKKGDHDDVVAFIYGLPVDFADPLFAFSMYVPGSVKDFQVMHEVRELEQLYNDAFNTFDKMKRAEALSKLSNYFVKNAIAVPLMSVIPRYAISKKIKSIGRQLFGLSIDFRNVELSK